MYGVGALEAYLATSGYSTSSWFGTLRNDKVCG